jgi:hypothetical protein
VEPPPFFVAQRTVIPLPFIDDGVLMIDVTIGVAAVYTNTIDIHIIESKM